MGCYAEYRESGVGWLGELPSHWELRRISALYDARNEKVSDQDYPPLSVTMQGIVPQLETAAKTQDGDNRKLVRTGDFVINSRSDRRGACGISEYDGSVTLISNVLAPKDRSTMSTRYYSYLFRSEGFADEFYRQGTGIVDDLWSTNWTRMKNILVARPPLAEQERIADYLDAKTTEIDALVTDCEREVALLQEYRKAVIFEAVTKGLDPGMPMKDSGVEWIGEIPDGWACIKAKHVVRISNGSDPQTEGDIPVFGSGESSFKTCGEYKEPPATLIGRKGATLHIPHYMTERYWNVDTAFNVNATSGYLDKYYYYVAMNFDYRFYLSHTTLPSMTQTAYENMFVPQPSLDEQRRIIDYLDAKTAEIDSLIEAKQEMADKLREYRKSLVSEAVTGKFKVPGV